MTRHRSPRCRSRKQSGWGFTFLGGNCQNKPDRVAVQATDEETFSLTQARPGDRLWVVTLADGKPHDLNLGDELHVINCTSSGSVIVDVAGQRVGFCQSRADAIGVSLEDPLLRDRRLTYLHAMEVGSTGRVKRYNCPRRSYRKRLLAMGLTPGTEFTVTRHAPLGDPVEIKVRGFSLSLRKDEARALLVEAVR